MARSSRLAFIAAAATRALRDSDRFFVQVGGTLFGRWVGRIVSFGLGVSLVGLWAWFDLPAWILGAVVVAVLLFGLGEGAFRTWRDLEVAVAGSGPVLGGGGKEEHIVQIPGINAYRYSFAPTHEEAHTLRVRGEEQPPTAVLFESPKAKQAVYAGSHLPAVVTARDGLRRHRIVIQRFVPGGVVLDEREAPVGQLVCVIHFGDSGEARSATT